MMKNYHVRTTVSLTMGVLLSVVFSSGCSVGMAMSGKKEPNLSQVKVGASRSEVELQLGQPSQIGSLEDGKRIDIYDYEIGNEPSAARAIGHGVLDVLTIGLWEVIGTPIEAYQGDKYRLQITYDKDDKVLAFVQQRPSQK